MAGAHTNGDLNHGIAFPLTNSEVLLECAVAADEAGWDGVFFQDHLTDWLATEPESHRAIADTWTTLAGIATLSTGNGHLGETLAASLQDGRWLISQPIAGEWQL